MRLPRIAISVSMLVLLALCLTARSRAERQPEPINANEFFYPSLVSAYHGAEPAAKPRSVDDRKSGIKEEVPEKYANRYREWKEEFLSTEAGRDQWASYQNNPTFLLTIAVSRDNAEGATTGNYEWNSAGQLVAATITLGIRLDAGYPNPIYFR